jgi:peptidoglycan/xylan/chitin deacetylase (PgdA/CDA1 family)/uncharacterized caspase-like protein
MSRKLAAVLCLCVLVSGCRGCGSAGPAPASQQPARPSAPQRAAGAVAPLPSDISSIVEPYRKIIVLMEGASALEIADQRRAETAGRLLYQDKHQRLSELTEALTEDVTARPAKLARVTTMLEALERHPDLRDADKLALRDVVGDVLDAAPADLSELRQRLTDDAAALREIQALYQKELEKIFGRYETRGMQVRREAWETYVAFLNSKYQAKTILEEHAADIRQVADLRTESALETSGTRLPPKSLVLTFDDGPHAKRTEQIVEILKRFNAKAVFFQVGQNVAPAGTRASRPRAQATARRIIDDGHALGNHSYSHALLPKLSDGEIADELERTNRALDAVAAKPVSLFRPPYGGRTQKVLAAVHARHMKSILWNIDSRDWADPIPLSIANRVLRAVDGEKRGILLFHDIQQQTVDALPTILETLQARGYRFLTWNGADFVDDAPAPAPQSAAAERAAPLYRESWAVVIGIDSYRHWPKLSYAANDARGIRDLLTRRFGFKPEHVSVLLNEEATRAKILEVLGDRMADPERIKKDDRVFVFFAGHGATRTLPNGRSQGYLIPADADVTNYHSQAISMTNFQDVSDAIPAKHVLFITDACYGGLALTRGGAQSYLQQVTRRTARQILTAGGADEQVADNGPNGHSIFTWTLMQGLEGRGDLNGDGFITASELASYTGPIVSSLSRQTPAFGALAGSEGGEFVFQLSHETEFLSEVSDQLEEEAIALNAELDRLKKAVAEKRSRNERLRQDVERARAEAEGTAPPRNASAEANDRGMALYRERKYAEALAAFEEAVRLGRTNALAANNAGFTLFKMKRYPEAVTWFERTIALDPGRAIAHANLGDALLALGRGAEARTAYEKYLELQPNGSYAATVRRRLEGIR